MRKIYLLVFITAGIGFTSNAQISKGSLFLGGSFGAFSSTSKEDTPSNFESKNSGFSFFPQIGKAIGTNKIAGLTLGYNQSTNKSNFNGQKQESKGYSAGAFYRRYYSLSSRFYLFGQGVLEWRHVNERQENDNALQRTSNNENFNFSITPGISYAASQRIHLEASLNELLALGYQTGKSKNYNATGGVSGTSTQKNLYLAGNGNGFSSITIGIRWILPSKTK
jgi:hypothetical protein